MAKKVAAQSKRAPTPDPYGAAPVSELEKEIREAWRANCRINHAIIDKVCTEGWTATLSTRGGRGVAGEFAHIHNIRLAQLQGRAKDLGQDLAKLDTTSEPSKTAVRSALKASDKEIERFLVGALRREKGRRRFKRGIFTTLAYFISHESHHRGRVLLTLKVSGNTLDRNTQMGIWAWDNV